MFTGGGAVPTAGEEIAAFGGRESRTHGGEKIAADGGGESRTHGGNKRGQDTIWFPVPS